MSSTMTSHSFPPHRTHSTKRITLPEANTLLSSYLHRAATDHSLHPNALLSEDGPSNAAGAVGMGLVMQNLQRVEAGLRGEYLGVEEELGVAGSGVTVVEENGGKGLAGAGGGETRVEEPSQGLVGKVEVEMADQWQDRDEFEREEEVLVGGEMGGEDVREGMGKVPKVGRGDKEERKRAKLERRRKEKREKEERRRKEKEAENGG